ncbi:MAG: hypothetical protein V8T87_13135 [Victivallales bacterium]
MATAGADELLFDVLIERGRERKYVSRACSPARAFTAKIPNYREQVIE